MKLPESLSNYIEAKTNPSWDKLILKLGLLQIVMSVVTLSLCPQWGVGWFAEFDGMRSLFMTFGHHWCEFLCGSFYAFSFFIGYRMAFTIFERRKFLSHPVAFNGLLVSSSFGFLLMLGGSFQETHFVWFLGYAIIYVVCLMVQVRGLGAKELLT